MTGQQAPLSFDDLATPLIDATFVVIDLETTGLDPATDAITEVGAVKIRGGEVLGEFGTLVRPQQRIPASVVRLTGITEDMVRDSPGIGEVLASLEPFFGNATMIAHNARFDHAFLTAAAQRHYRAFDPPVIDTVRLARRLLRDEVRDLRLSTLAHHLGAPVTPDHRALTDARATVAVFHALLERAGTLGATTLEDLKALTRSASDRRFRKIDLVTDAPREPGVYQFRDATGRVLYVGKASNLRSRLRSYFTSDRRRQVEAMVRETAAVTWRATPTLLEAEVIELREIHQLLPRFNRRSTKRISGWHVALTDEAFPRLSIVRTPGRHHRRAIGPIASRAVARQFVDAVTAAGGLRTCTFRIRRSQDHSACMLKELDQCAAPCDGSQSTEDYERAVSEVESWLDDPSELLDRIESGMQSAAASQHFEHARDQRAALHATARIFWEHRWLNALAAAGELIVARDVSAGVEVLCLSNGSLSHSFTDAAGTPDDVLIARARLTPTAVCPRTSPDVTERRLVVSTLQKEAFRILDVTGTFAWSLPAGDRLAGLVDQARQFNRPTTVTRQVAGQARPTVVSGRGQRLG
ncbi:MAG: DEDD exonuclease domain-containing protein [Nitriliruptoraceae bacterium]